MDVPVKERVGLGYLDSIRLPTQVALVIVRRKRHFLLFIVFLIKALVRRASPRCIVIFICRNVQLYGLVDITHWFPYSPVSMHRCTV